MFKLHFLPIRYGIDFKICLLAFKIKRKLSPNYLIQSFNDFRPNTQISLRIGSGRDTTMFKQLPNFLNNKLLFCKLIEKWNKLPISLRIIESISEFKTKLKSHYIRLAFPEFV